MLAFEERGKPEYPEKNLWSKDENQQQTQPTYDAGSGNRWYEASKVTTVPSLCHPCSPKLDLFSWAKLHVPCNNLRVVRFAYNYSG